MALAYLRDPWIWLCLLVVSLFGTIAACAALAINRYFANPRGEERPNPYLGLVSWLMFVVYLIGGQYWFMGYLHRRFDPNAQPYIYAQTIGLGIGIGLGTLVGWRKWFRDDGVRGQQS